jgi:serine/threonine-protein kinase RsbW
MPRFRAAYPATLDVQSGVADRMADALGDMGVSEDVRDRALLLASEAFTNAVEHSCAHDARQTVTIEMWEHAGGVRVRITDTGAGFDHLPDASLPADPLAEGGRGLYLIQTLAQQVTYDLDGRRVTMDLLPE